MLAFARQAHVDMRWGRISWRVWVTLSLPALGAGFLLGLMRIA